MTPEAIGSVIASFFFGLLLYKWACQLIGLDSTLISIRIVREDN